MRPHRLAALLAVVATAGAAASASVPASSAAVSVIQGATLRTAIFPNDQLTVADSEQITGKRINLRAGVDYPACDSTNYSICDGVAMLNQLDGFDIQPRVTIPFTAPIKMDSVTDTSISIQGPGGFRTGLGQLVWDPASYTLAGIAKDQLIENTTYTIVVTSGVQDASGSAIDACGGTCGVSFTTRTASPELEKIRKALDDGSAYATAGISQADRTASFLQGTTRETFPASSVSQIQRVDQVLADPAKAGAMVASTVLNSAVVASTYAFGSVYSPRYQYRSADFHQDDPSGYSDGVIPQVPSTQTPQPFGKDRIGFILIVPPGPTPAGGWPTAIYGPGFSRSKYDIFLTADLNAAGGVATMATDPAGHAFGPQSQVIVSQGPTNSTFLGFGRGRDLDGDGDIINTEGVGPTKHTTVDASGKIKSELPPRKPIDGVRSGLVQTVVDNMALVRMIENGVDVPGTGETTLRKSGVMYYGLSFGGIYGDMLMATDTHLAVGLLNVGGGPIADIARLSGFRNLLADALKVSRPNLLNGGPGLDGFTESIPLRLDPPVTNPYRGAMQIQETLADSNWFDRSGSPETFGPLLRLRPLAGEPQKKLIFQSAFGDQTVPNPTAGNVYRAGKLFDMVTYYRNDKTPTFGSDPHGFLEDPRLSGRSGGQAQLGTFLQSGGSTVIDPDGPGPVFEVPPVNPINFECLHFVDPQTGQAPAGQPNMPDCAPSTVSFNAPGPPPPYQPPYGSAAANGGPGPALMPNTSAEHRPGLWAALLVLFALLTLTALVVMTRRRAKN